MTAPPKPWENVSRNQDTSFIHSAGPSGTTVVPGGLRPVVRNHAAAPPLPPRSTRSSGLGSMGIARYPYAAGGYGGMYSGYGGAYGGYGFSPYPMRQTEFENRLIDILSPLNDLRPLRRQKKVAPTRRFPREINEYVQMAEESAAPAFESIDNFVRGFSSVTMMLESTFQAMHMSFRAVLGVAENMSRMKAALFEFLSAFAILKTIYHFYRKILYTLGLVNGADVTWKEAEAAVSGKPITKAKPRWPMLAFLAAIIAGPTLVYKYLLPETLPPDEEVEIVGMYDFESDQPGELSFIKGEVMLAKRSTLRKHWVMARKGSNKGYVPHNRIGVLRRPTGNQGSQGTGRVSVTNRPLQAEGATSTAGMPPTTAEIPRTTTGINPTTTEIPRTTTGINPTTAEVPLTTIEMPPTTAGVPPTTAGIPQTITVMPLTTTGINPTMAGIPPTKTVALVQPPKVTGNVGLAVEGVSLPVVHRITTTAVPVTATVTQTPITPVPSDDAASSSFTTSTAQENKMNAASANACPIIELPESAGNTFQPQHVIMGPLQFKAPSVNPTAVNSQQSLAAPTTSLSQSSTNLF